MSKEEKKGVRSLSADEIAARAAKSDTKEQLFLARNTNQALALGQFAMYVPRVLRGAVGAQPSTDRVSSSQRFHERQARQRTRRGANKLRLLRACALTVLHDSLRSPWTCLLDC